MRLLGGTTLAVLALAVAPAQASHRKSHPSPEKQVEEKRQEPSSSPAPVMVTKGPTRVDFDDRLLQGQTNRLGAVYLYQRKDPTLPSLLDRRKSFRSEIRRDVLE